jgi:hypothetical protein
VVVVSESLLEQIGCFRKSVGFRNLFLGLAGLIVIGGVVQNLINQFGCDSIHTVTTTLLPSDSTFENNTSCNPADTGIISQTFVNRFGCDSVHTVTTSFSLSDSTFENLTSCNPADTGVVVHNIVNKFGCDSIHTTKIT